MTGGIFARHEGDALDIPTIATCSKYPIPTVATHLTYQWYGSDPCYTTDWIERRRERRRRQLLSSKPHWPLILPSTFSLQHLLPSSVQLLLVLLLSYPLLIPRCTSSRCPHLSFSSPHSALLMSFSHFL